MSIRFTPVRFHNFVLNFAAVRRLQLRWNDGNRRGLTGDDNSSCWNDRFGVVRNGGRLRWYRRRCCEARNDGGGSDGEFAEQCQ